MSAVEHHNPMEMHATTVVWEGDGKITVYDKTQGPQNVQDYLAAVFGFSAKNVRVMNPYVGGGFGSGLRPQYQVYLAVLAAKLLERSVRVVLTRQQMFTHVHRPEAMHIVTLGADADGKLTAIIQDATTSTSRFENYMEDVVIWGMMNYACHNASRQLRHRAARHLYAGRHARAGRCDRHDVFEMAIDEMAYEAKHRSAGISAAELFRYRPDERDAVHQQGVAGSLRGRRGTRSAGTSAPPRRAR